MIIKFDLGIPILLSWLTSPYVPVLDLVYNVLSTHIWNFPISRLHNDAHGRYVVKRKLLGHPSIPGR